MEAILFNIKEKLRKARDLVVAEAPNWLDSAANAFGQIEDASRQLADFIRRVGPSVSFATPGSIENVNELKKLRDECESIIGGARKGDRRSIGTSDPDLLDNAGDLDPELRDLLLAAIVRLIERLLAKTERRERMEALKKGQSGPTPNKSRPAASEDDSEDEDDK